MSYTVLARKYRSQTFDEVIGQPAITTTLRNAISGNRVHHGYLFCGTRGVGKTSMARILAKALNCLAADAPTVAPCGSCDSCRAIAEGEDIDVIEIDAASNTGVDHIRELRSNAALSPARARFKIYIIDEVHMLSAGAFNALLKTLEEPPRHVKFILATTDPQRVPATIQSRVQRFDFRPISADDIAAQLTRICEAENVRAEPAAVRRIARLAAGSMRDALSLLDQVLSLSGDSLTAAQVDEVLPAPHDELLADLIDRLADADAAGALAVVDRSLGRGDAPDQWCTNLINQVRNLLILNVCGPNSELVDAPAALRERLVAQAARFDSSALVFIITVLEELRRAARFSGAGRALIEAAVVRLADATKFSSLETLLAGLESSAPPARKATPPAATARPPTPRPPTSAPLVDKKKVPPAPVSARSVSAPVAVRAPTPSPRTRREDLEAAYAEPLVKRAVEVFDGTILKVERNAAPAPNPQPPRED